MKMERGAVCAAFVLLAAVLAEASSPDLLPEDTAYEMITEYMDYYPHPKLPYAYDALDR